MNSEQGKPAVDTQTRETAETIAKPVERAARTIAEEVGGSVDLAIDLLSGKKTVRGILNGVLDDIFGTEKPKTPEGKPDLKVVGGTDEKAAK